MKVKRRGFATSTMLLLCLITGCLIIFGSMQVGGERLRSVLWGKRRNIECFDLQSGLQWAKWRLQSDKAFLSLSNPQTTEEVKVNESVSIHYNIENGAKRAILAGPDMPVPSGYQAALYCMVLDDFSPDALSDPAPIATGDLVPEWTVSDTASGNIDSCGIFEGDLEGELIISVPNFTTQDDSIVIEEANSFNVLVSDEYSGEPQVRMSPRVSVVNNHQPVYITALLYTTEGIRQVCSPLDSFEIVSGTGALEDTPWGVAYYPEEPGWVTIRAAVTEGEIVIEDEIVFEVVPCQRLVQVTLSVRGIAKATAWLRDYGDRAIVLTSDFHN